MARKNNVNAEIISKMEKHNVFQWEVAKKVGVSEGLFCRWMREELSPERKEQAMKAIDEIATERGKKHE